MLRPLLESAGGRFLGEVEDEMVRDALTEFLADIEAPSATDLLRPNARPYGCFVDVSRDNKMGGIGLYPFGQFPVANGIHPVVTELAFVGRFVRENEPIHFFNLPRDPARNKHGLFVDEGIFHMSV